MTRLQQMKTLHELLITKHVVDYEASVEQFDLMELKDAPRQKEHDTDFLLHLSNFRCLRRANMHFNDGVVV